MDVSLEPYGQTVIHPAAIGFTLLMGAMVLFLPRRFAIFPMVLVACFIPVKQRLVVATLDFDMLRVLVLFGWTRILLMREYHSFRFNIIDGVLVFWIISRIVIYSIKWATPGALVYQLGQAFDAVGMYFMFRCLIREFDEIEVAFKAIAIISVPLAISMLIENRTGRNAFSVFGGVPEMTVIRQGRLRCQGAFSHPIMAGSFGATLFPLILTLWRRGGINKALTIAGGFAASSVVVFSSSSGPLIAYFTAILGMGLWPFRQFVRVFGLGLIVCLIAVQMYLGNPIWSLVEHMDVVGGSTASHRYALVDAAIKGFHEWWLVGLKSTDHWGWGLWDITNQFILEGIYGGLLTLILFVLLIVLCFQGLSRALDNMGEQVAHQLCLWGLGVSLLASVVSFMGVSYFGQMSMIWYLQLALISTACDAAGRVRQPS